MVGIFTDGRGKICSFSGDEPGLHTAYVVFRPDASGFRSIRFSAPVPSCMGAVFVEDYLPDGLRMIGSSQTGISIASWFCEEMPRNILVIRFLRTGSTTPCCPYPILEDPYVGMIETLDCAFQPIQTAGLAGHFNADESCRCGFNEPPDPPSNPSPPHGADLQSVTSVLSWTATDPDSNLAAFDVYLGTTDPPPLVAPGLTQLSYLPAPLKELTTYFWRVVAHDDWGEQTSGPVWAFRTRLANSPPDIPSGPTPGNGATGVPLGTQLQWGDYDIDRDPLVYDLYFGTLKPPPLVVTSLTATQYVPGNLSFATTYYWRVVARDPPGHTTSSPVWWFITRPENYPPDAPSKPMPANGAQAQFTKVKLEWTASDRDASDKLVFDVYFGTSPTPPVVKTGLSVKSYTPPPLAFSTQYYWRVVVRDGRGGETFGPTWSFTTKANSPPTTPSSPSPANGAMRQSVIPTLRWESADVDYQTVSFDIYFGTESPPPLVVGGVTGRSYAPGRLAFTTAYWWRIVARDPLGAEAVGPIWSFTTKSNSAPGAPTAPTPANSGFSTAGPVLNWSAVDVDGQTLTFDLYLGATSPPGLVASGLTSPSYASGELQAATQYYWRVVASDGELSTSGATWTFTTVQPGDADQDGQVTLADAACALQSYAWLFGCAGDHGVLAADVDCSGGVTPRDALCIHRRAVDIPCTFCGESPAGPVAATTPSVSLEKTWEIGDTLFARLRVAGVASLEAFGFNVKSDLQLMQATQRGATSGFDALVSNYMYYFGGFVGGYALSGAPATTYVSLVDLRFLELPWFESRRVEIGSFVDDLAGAPALEFHFYNDMPVLISRFSAAPSGTGIDVNWELESDEVVERITLYRRREAALGPAVVGADVITPATRVYRDRSVEPGATYRYELLVRTSGGNEFRSPVAIATARALELALGPNRPNPFNPQTVIPYAVPGSAVATRVRLRIVDTSGRIVRTLIDGNHPPGSHEAVWNGRDDRGDAVSSGIYFCVLEAGKERRVRKLVLLK